MAISIRRNSHFGWIHNRPQPVFTWSRNLDPKSGADSTSTPTGPNRRKVWAMTPQDATPDTLSQTALSSGRAEFAYQAITLAAMLLVFATAWVF